MYEGTIKVRIPARAWAYIEGTQAWADRDRPEELAKDGAEAAAIWRKVHDAPTRKDGSCTVELSKEEREVFLDYATAWVLGPEDNAGPDDMDALHDLRSLRSLIGNLQK